MRITALVENTAGRQDVLTEHGLSLYIETGSHRILFDLGQGDMVLKNAQTLGIDVTAVDIAVISHGHYDHGGGLSHFLEVNRHAPVYISKRAFGKYHNGSGKYIGLDTSLFDNSRLVFTDTVTGLCRGLTLFSCNDRQYSTGDSGLTMVVDGTPVPDRFLHEQYLLIEEHGKRVLISGCSHKGITDIVSWFTPDVLVGGFHLFHTDSPAVLNDTARSLDGFDTDYYTCHCTGTEQYDILKETMHRLNYLSCGQSITL